MRILISNKELGSSIVEFLVSLAVFIPLFVGIPLLGKYADIKHKTIEASRYVAWERTVYPAPEARWNDGYMERGNNNLQAEITKSDMDILLDAEKRFFGHPQQGLHQAEVMENPMWKNRKGESLLALSNEEGSNGGANQEPQLKFMSGSITEVRPVSGNSGTLTQFTGGAVEAVATGFGSLGNLFSGSEDAADIPGQAESGSQEISDAMEEENDYDASGIQCSVPGMDIGRGMNLGRNNYAQVEVNTPVLNFLKMNDEDGDLNFTAKAAVLSNAWTAPSEVSYYQRLDNLVPNQLLGCITLPGRYTFGLLGRRGRVLYGEGQYSYKVHLPGYDNDPFRARASTVLPNGLTYYDESRD